MKILKAATLALPLMSGASAASAAPGNTSQTTAAAAAQGSVQSVGYYVPECVRVFVGYDWDGYPVYQRRCW